MKAPPHVNEPRGLLDAVGGGLQFPNSLAVGLTVEQPGVLTAETTSVLFSP